MLKKPIVAAIICVIVVLLSTVVSVRARLNPQCEAVSESFRSPGGIADQLETVCDASAGLVNLAESYELADFESFNSGDLCVALRVAINNSEPSSLMNLYSLLKANLSVITAELQRADLSDKDAQLLAEYSAQLEKAQAAISADPYNSSVKAFLQELGGFSRGMARLCGVDLPQQFA